MLRGTKFRIFILLPGNEFDTPWICVWHLQGVPTPQVRNPWSTFCWRRWMDG